jgi:hypothetical protein
MGELKDKAKGVANEAAGEVKQHSDDPETRSEGKAPGTQRRDPESQGRSQRSARQQGVMA